MDVTEVRIGFWTVRTVSAVSVSKDSTKDCLSFFDFFCHFYCLLSGRSGERWSDISNDTYHFSHPKSIKEENKSTKYPTGTTISIAKVGITKRFHVATFLCLILISFSTIDQNRHANTLQLNLTLTSSIVACEIDS